MAPSSRGRNGRVFEDENPPDYDEKQKLLIAGIVGHADTAWELFHRLNRSEIEYYLQDRASKGFNVVQAVVIAEINGTTRPNFYGDLAILDSDPFQPNDAYFQHVDWAVKKAAEYGILIAMVPTWGRYINCGWHGEPIIFNETSAEFFGSYIGKRYPGLPKIVGADSNGFWACNAITAKSAYEADPSVDQSTLLDAVVDSRPTFVAMANGLKSAEAEAGYEAFVIWHPTAMWIPGYGLPYGHNVSFPVEVRTGSSVEQAEC